MTVDLIRTRVHPEDVSLIEKLKIVDQLSDGGTDVEWQYRLVMPDRSTKYLHAVAHAARDHDGQLEYIAAVQDVTARRMSEQELQRVAAEQEALRKAATLVASGASPTEVFAAITASAAEVFGVPFASLIRVGPDETATMVAGCAACSAYVGRNWTVPADDPGITRTVVDSCRPSRIEDHSRVQGPVGEAARALGVGSVVGAPVVVDGSIWGVLAVGAAQNGPPLAPDAADRLANFAELVSTAIVNTEARDQVRRLLNEQETLRRVATLIARGASPDAVFAAVCDEAAELFDTEMAAVGRFEADEPALVTVGLSAGVRGMTIGMRTELEDWLASTAVYRTGHTARRDVTAEEITGTGPIADAVRAMGFLSTVSAPIVVEGRLWGVMTASDSRHALAPDTEKRIENFTELIATAIANREARDQVTRLLDEQSALRRVATLVAESPVSEELFSAVAREVAGVLNVSGVLVERFEPDGSVLTLGTAYDADLQRADAFFAVGMVMPRDPGSLAAQVFETRRPRESTTIRACRERSATQLAQQVSDRALPVRSSSTASCGVRCASSRGAALCCPSGLRIGCTTSSSSSPRRSRTTKHTPRCRRLQTSRRFCGASQRSLPKARRRTGCSTRSETKSHGCSTFRAPC